MTLSQLDEAVRQAVAGTLSDPDKVEVLITLDFSHLGPRASTGVTSAHLGFDWVDGQFRLEPADKLTTWRKDRDTALPPREQTMDDGQRKLHTLRCPACPNEVKRTDRYCPQCGQRLKRSMQ